MLKYSLIILVLVLPYMAEAASFRCESVRYDYRMEGEGYQRKTITTETEGFCGTSEYKDGRAGSIQRSLNPLDVASFYRGSVQTMHKTGEKFISINVTKRINVPEGVKRYPAKSVISIKGPVEMNNPVELWLSPSLLEDEFKQDERSNIQVKCYITENAIDPDEDCEPANR